MPKNKLPQLAVPAGLVGIVLMLVVPLPAFFLDMLIAVNIMFALLILLVSMFVLKALDFSIFPSIVLVATLFRLALNVSATRLVLRDGEAGNVIGAFGHFVAGGSLVIGLVIFFILVVIQFMVVTKGAERVAEVGARFTLDAMPGKQMAIDADLNQGMIDEAEARKRRQEVSSEADFYGAMDGASKFVKGDAIAAVIITVINLLGGFVIGVVQHHLSPGEAITTYSLLSIGDGLVSQIPALLISVATGLIVTRSTTQGDLGTDVIGQLSRQILPLRIAGGAMLLLCVIPGLPKLPFLVVGLLVVFASTRLKSPEEKALEELPPPVEQPSPDSPEALAEDMRVDALALELACDLIDLVDTTVGGDLLDRVRSLRRKVALDLGLVIPPVRTRDDLELPLSTYVIKIGGVVAGRGEAPTGAVLAISDALEGLPGTPTREPVFGLAAKWVPMELRHQAELLGATVVDRASVITTHMAEVVRDGASRLLGREEVRSLVEMVKRTHPVVVEELTPAMLNLGEVQRVLHALLDEGVSIRDLPRIFEALSLRAKVSADVEGLVEAARAALGPAISAPHAVDDLLRVVTLDPRLEQSMFESMVAGDGGTHILLDGERLESLTMQLARMVEQAEQRGFNPVLVCSPQVRPGLRRLVRTSLPRLPVLSYGEVTGQLRIETIGVVEDVHATAA
ncbi:flagellar biosynthesis protein FlhA [Motilibacter peucedani]|uniref:Flagellar biosynthesis protein FlhA n=1 Tax=Motilibacter peucedani TaxID=598650 RepID=A0A420XQS9_9ACTN|nr:flagellar biosynthesis protein FlhA [Motilibacter peucedani]RKS75605.1 flagellar biosynthesis protein FlhA [Motilibacter peucedani]